MQLKTFATLILAIITTVADAQQQDLCACPVLDVIYLIDRCYFTNMRYNRVIQPIMIQLTDNLAQCADLRVAFVEYGMLVNLNSTLDKNQPSAAARNYTKSYTVGPTLGTFPRLGEAFEVVRNQVLNPMRGHRESAPTSVIVFMGTETHEQTEIKNETDQLKAQNIKIVVVGVGSRYNKINAQEIASSPSLFYVTDYFGNQGRDIAGNLTNMLNTASCPAGMSSTSTQMPTTQMPQVMPPSICYAPDVVFIFDRSYFNTPVFAQQVHPILQDFSRRLDSCVDIHISFVEYNKVGLLRFPFNYFESSADSRQALEIYAVGPDLGEASNLEDAYMITRVQALTPKYGHRQNNPTYVVTFLGNDPSSAARAIEEAERLKLEKGAMAIVLAFGSSYNADLVRILASSPSLFYPVSGYSQADSNIASSWLLSKIRPGFTAPLPAPPVPETSSTLFVSTSTTPTPTTSTSTMTESSTSTSTSSSTSQSTALPYCPSHDSVFVFQRSCFNQAAFNKYIQPILTNYADHLDPCVGLNTAYVEYGSWANVRHYYSDFKTTNDAKNFMKSYTVGDDLGSGSSIDEAFKVVNHNVLRDASARNLNNPTYVYTFVCNTPPNEMKAIQEAENLKLAGGIVSILGFGDHYDPQFIRILSSSPDLYKYVPSNPNYDEITNWMTSNAALPTIIPTSTTTTTTITSPTPTSTSTSSTITSSSTASSTTSYTTSSACPSPDTVYVFQRSCFNQTGFNQQVQPILSSFANSLNQCVGLYTAYVEYGSNANIRYRYGDFKTTQDAKNFMQHYQVGDDRGPGADVDQAFSTVRTGVLRDAASRSLNNPTYVYTFLCNTPAFENRAIEQAENLRLDGAIIQILAFGNRYDPNFIRVLASSPSLYLPVGANPNYGEIAQWMMSDAGLPTGPSTTPTVPTSTVPASSTSSSTVSSTSSTGTYSTSPACPSPDTVYVFQRSCFNQTGFNQQVQPILSSFANSLNQCVGLYTAYVEYGSNANIRYRYGDFKTTQDAKNFMQNYQVGDDRGPGADVDQAFNTVRTGVLRDISARSLNNPTYVYTFLCDTPAFENRAIEEAENLRLDGGIIQILAFGNRYNPNFIKVLASSPSLYLPVGANPNYGEIAQWMMSDAGMPTGPSTTPTIPTSTVPTSSTSSSTASSTSSTGTYTTSPACPSPDTVYVFQRSCFNQTGFNQQVQPILSSFANSLNQCVGLYTAYVEYGSNANIRYRYGDFKTTQDAKNFMQHYQVGDDRGPAADVDQAFSTVRTGVLRDISARSLNNPTYVYTFLCDTPTFENRAIEEAENLRLDGGIIQILAFGNRYNPNFIKVLASSPNLYLPVGANPNYGEIAQWMMSDAGMPTGPSTTPTVPTSTVPTSSTSSSTASSTSSTGTYTTSPACPSPDTVYVFQRSCFNQTGFNQQVQPILSSFANDLNQCVSLYTAYVEYGSNANIRYRYSDFRTTQDAKNFMQNYQVGDDRGPGADVDQAFSTVRSGVLRDASARSMNNPTYVYTFLCDTPAYQNRAIEEAENLRLDGGIIQILAFGNRYNPNFIRVLANSPNLFMQVGENPNYGDIARWMMSDAGFPTGVPVTPTIFTTTLMTTVPTSTESSTLTSSTFPTSTESTTESTTLTSSTTETSTLTSSTSSSSISPTGFFGALPPAAPVYGQQPQPCHQIDVVYVIDRIYFTPEMFDKTIHPIFVIIADNLPQCVDLRTSIVEYGSSSNTRFYLDKYCPTSSLKPALRTFTAGDSLGSQSDLACAYKTVRTDVLTPQRGRRSVRSVVITFLANNPSNQSNAINEAELLKLSNDTVIEVVGYGKNYDPENVRILSNGPDHFFPVSDQYIIEMETLWTLMAINASACETTPAPSSTGMPGCCTVDMVIIVDRSYFDADRFVREGRPVLLDFINNKLPTCADIRYAIVEYGTYVFFNKEFDDNLTPSDLAQYVPSLNVGSQSNAGDAFEAVHVQVVAPFKGRRPGAPLLVLGMMGSNPTDQADAVDEAEFLKGDEAIVTIFAFGSQYAAENVRVLASSPTFFYPVSNNATFQNDTTELVNYLCPGAASTTPSTTTPSTTTAVPLAGGMVPLLTTESSSTVSTTRVFALLPQPPVVSAVGNETTMASEFCFRCRGRCQHTGFYANPNDCHTFFQCFYFSRTKAIGILQQCPPGQFFYEEISVCVPEGATPCTDVCQNLTAIGNNCYASANNCAEFFICSNGISYQQCCPVDTGFDETICGCRSEVACDEVCTMANQTSVTLPPPVIIDNSTCIDQYNNTLQAYPGYPNRFVILYENKVYALACAPGTKFDPVVCRCEFDETANVTYSSSLQALLYLPFEDNFQDYSVQRFITYPCANNVELVNDGAVSSSNSSALFNGGQIEVPGLKNVDLRDQASWCLFFRCLNSTDNSTNCTGGLLSNNEGFGGLYTIIIATNGSNLVALVRGQNGQTVTLSAPITSGWSQVCVVFTGGVAKLYTNGRQADTEGLASRLALGHCNYVIGSDPTYGRFYGNIDNVLVTYHAMTQDEIDAHYNGNNQQLIQKGVLPAES